MKNAGSVSKHKKIIAFMVVWPALSLVCYGLESFPETTQIPHPALSQGEREKLSFPSPLGESPFGPGACSARYNRVPAAHATPEGADEGPEQLPFPSKLEIQPIVDLEAPTVPRGLEVRRTGRNAILDWDESIDHVTGVVGYRVYRDGLLIAEVERAPYVDKDVSAGTKRYQITGVDGAGNESALSTPTVSGDLQGPGPAAGEVYSYPNPAVGGSGAGDPRPTGGYGPSHGEDLRYFWTTGGIRGASSGSLSRFRHARTNTPGPAPSPAEPILEWSNPFKAASQPTPALKYLSSDNNFRPKILQAVHLSITPKRPSHKKSVLKFPQERPFPIPGRAFAIRVKKAQQRLLAKTRSIPLPKTSLSGATLMWRL
jgi:hypothetical protein